MRILRLLLQVYGGNDIAASITCFTVVRIVRLLLQVYGGNDIAASITGYGSKDIGSYMTGFTVKILWLLLQALWW